MHYKQNVTHSVADFSKHPVLIELGNEPQKKIIFIDSDTNKKIIAYSQKTKHGWIAVAQQDYGEAFAAVTQAKRDAIVILVITLSLVVLLSFISASMLNKLLQDTSTLKRNIFPRVFFTIVVVAAIPLVAIWFINDRATFDRFTQQRDNRLSIESDILVTYINTWMEMNLRMLRQNAALNNIKSMDSKKQKPALLAIAKEYPWLWVITVRSDGQTLTRSDNEALKNFADRDWFQKAMRGSDFASDVVLSKNFNKPIWTLAVPIFEEEKKVTGVLQLASFLDDLSETITNTTNSKTGRAYLLNDKGKIVAHQKKAFTQLLLDFSKHPTFTELGDTAKKKILFTKEGAEKPTISYVQRTEYGWVLVLEQGDDNEGYKSISKKNQIKLIVTLLLILVISFIVSRRISRW